MQVVDQYARAEPASAALPGGDNLTVDGTKQKEVPGPRNAITVDRRGEADMLSRELEVTLNLAFKRGAGQAP
jgi:hypothetical protein